MKATKVQHMLDFFYGRIGASLAVREKMMKAIITIGCSGSGKSSWARNHARENNFAIVERDEYRKALHPKKDANDNFWKSWNWKCEDEITKLVNEAILWCANQKTNVIISDTNLNPKLRILLIQKLKSLGYEVEEKHFFLEYKELLKRDNQRADSVGAQVIAKQYFQYMKEFGSMHGFVSQPQRNHDDLPTAIVVDIDGTIALHTSDRTPYEWDRVDEDSACPHIGSLIRMLGGSHTVIMLSGRDAVCREKTIQWLSDNEIPCNALFMRQEGDNRPDFIVKNELFQNYIAGKYFVNLWFDDRPVIVRLAHVLGVKCVAVANPFIEF